MSVIQEVKNVTHVDVNQMLSTLIIPTGLREEQGQYINKF